MNGDLMFTASSDGEIFVMDGRPSKNFAMLGFVCKLFHNHRLLMVILLVVVLLEVMVVQAWLAAAIVMLLWDAVNVTIILYACQ